MAADSLKLILFADADWLSAERFTILFNALIGLITAITAAVAAWTARQARNQVGASEQKVTAHLTKQDVKQDEQMQRVEVIEKQTNGLVNKVAELAHDSGMAKGELKALKESKT